MHRRHNCKRGGLNCTTQTTHECQFDSRAADFADVFVEKAKRECERSSGGRMTAHVDDMSLDARRRDGAEGCE